MHEISDDEEMDLPINKTPKASSVDIVTIQSPLGLPSRSTGQFSIECNVSRFPFGLETLEKWESTFQSKSGNFDQTEKAREFYPKYWKRSCKSVHCRAKKNYVNMDY